MRPSKFDNRIKRRWIADRHLAEHLAIQLNTGRNQRGDESAIGDAAHLYRSAKSSDPKLAEVALFLAAIAVGVSIRSADELQSRAILHAR